MTRVSYSPSPSLSLKPNSNSNSNPNLDRNPNPPSQVYFLVTTSTRGGTVAKCHSTAEENLKTAIMDKLEGKHTCPDETFKVMVKGHFTFVSCLRFFFKKRL